MNTQTKEIILSESKEIKQVPVFPLSGFLKIYLKKFQEMLLLIKLDTLDEKEVKKIKENLNRYSSYNFSKTLLKNINDYLESIYVAKEEISKSLNLSSVNEIKEEFFQGNYKNVYNESLVLSRKIKSYLLSLTKTKKKFTKFSEIKKSPLHQLFSGGQRTGLLSLLDQSTIDDIISVDLEGKYTYLYPQHSSSGLNLPDATSEIEYLIYIISKLKDSPKAVRLSSKDFEIYYRIMNPQFSELRKLIQHYIFSNDKKSIEKIKELITPDIRQAIIKSTQGIKVVYRGLNGIEAYNKNEIRETEKKIRFISTSPDKYVAERFAKAKGHLNTSDKQEDEGKESTLLTYDISNKDCVIFSTAIFGEAFGESDILIDSTKATLLDISPVYY